MTSICTARSPYSSARRSSASIRKPRATSSRCWRFAAGFLVRPFGALVFGRIGDLVGRKYTFLVTIMIMGLSTFLVGLLPGSASIGIAAPIILIGCACCRAWRSAANMAARRPMSPNTRRTTDAATYTSWIQTTATLGLFLSLIVILLVQTWLGKEGLLPHGAGAFRSWFPVVLLGISVWIRLSLNESPAFQRMKEEGKGSKAPLSEAFGQWKNAKIALLALLGLTAGQAVVWYSGQFYALFFLQNVLKVDGQSVNIMIAISLALGTGFFVFFGWLSDKIGRKPIIMAGLALAIVTYFPLFKALTWPPIRRSLPAQQNVRATVTAAPGDCRFQFNPVGTAKFTTSCDIATSFLTQNSVPYDVVPTCGTGTAATGQDRRETIESFDAVAAGDQAKAKEAAFGKAVNIALHDGGYPLVREPAKVADQKLDAFVAANPELNLDAAAIRGWRKDHGSGRHRPSSDKLMTAEEAAGATEVAVYSVPGAGAFRWWPTRRR